MTKEELLKQVLGCPFCGELPELLEVTGLRKILYCGNDECGAQAEVTGDDYEELLTKWNTRAKL